MEQEKVSVIVPIYNTKRELFEACLSSITHQTYQNIEILLIDDGSQPWCARMIDEFGAQDPRIKIVHRQNGGVSAARNFGMEWAEGEWITFIDSDDIAEPLMIEHGMRIAREHNVEFVVGMIREVHGTGIPQNASTLHGPVKLYTKEKINELRAHFFVHKNEFGDLHDWYICHGPYARLVKTEIARTCFFPTDSQLGEDLVWNLRLLEKVPRVAVAYEGWYNYIECSTSIVHRYDERCVQWVAVRQKLIDEEIIAIHPELKPMNEIFFQREFFFLVSKSFLLHPDCPMSWKEKKSYLRKLLRQYPYQGLTDCRIRANKDGVKLLLLRSGLILEAYRLKMKLIGNN